MSDRSPADEVPPRVLGYSDLEGVYDHPARVGRFAGELTARNDDRTLVVGAGDDTALGTLGLLGDDGPGEAHPFFEAVAPDAETVGNHDLDLGDEWFREWAASVPTDYVCANLAGPYADAVPDAVVREAAGADVAVVGVAHPETAAVSGTDFDARFRDPVPAVRAALAERDVDRAVVLSHGGAHDAAVARETDVDAVVGGHSHERRVDVLDGTALVRTGGGGRAFAEVVLADDPRATVREVPAAAPEGGDEGDAPFDAALAESYRRRRRALGVAEVVARVEKPVRRERVHRRGGESRLGNFVADAFLAATDADCAVVPAGMVRAGPPLSGEVTAGDVVSISPFGGDLAELALTGERLRTELAALATPGAEEWLGGHVAGLRVRWDRDGGVASLAVDGEPADPSATYRVATADYLVVADEFERITDDDLLGRRGKRYEALVAHARRGGLDVDVDGRVGLVGVEGSESTSDADSD
ncbi:MAG: bifunctional UDP-sugar hydrolase/5'-nucleotidase [Halolamina sp.]